MNDSPGLRLQDGKLAPVRTMARFGHFVIASLLLVLCFARPLFQLARFAASNEHFTHILIVPFLSLFLAWAGRGKLPGPSAPRRSLSFIFFALGLAALASSWAAGYRGVDLATDDSLALSTLSFELMFAG